MFRFIPSSEWRKIKNESLGFHILRTSYIVGIITLSSRFIYVIRDLLIAWTFGRSQSLEAFILAFLIPYAFINALSESLTITFLPRFIELRENGDYKLANEIYANLFGLLFLLSTVVILLIVVTHSIYAPIVAAGFSVEGFSLLHFLIYFTAPAALLNGVTVFWKEILNAKGKFVRSSIVSVITPLLSVVLLVFMKDLGVWVLSLGLLFGVILELIILGVFLKTQKFDLLPRLSFSSLHLKIPIGDWWRVFISLTLFNSMGLINSFMAARRAEVGGLAALSYGKKIVTLPNDISAITYSTVLIPYLSKITASKDWKRVLRILNKWMLLVFVTTLPVVLIILFSSNYIVELLYERGAFNADDTRNVSLVVIYYIFQLPFFVSFYVLLRILPIIKKNTSTVSFGVLGVVLTFLFNFIFIHFLGTYGIALATSCVYLCLSAGLYLYLRNNLKRKIKEKNVSVDLLHAS